MIVAQLDTADETKRSQEIAGLLRAHDIAWHNDLCEHLDVSYDLTSFGRLEMVVLGEETPMVQFVNRCKGDDGPRRGLPLHIYAAREDDESSFRLLCEVVGILWTRLSPGGILRLPVGRKRREGR